MKSAGIVGLGLIGGSLAKDLARSGMHVLAHDADSHTLERALASGVVSGTLGTGLEHAADVDCLILAVPVDRAPDLLRTARPFLDSVSLITDVGSTKRSIAAAASELGLGPAFVGSHPFTGSHSAGWDAAREGLFTDARVFICPTEESELAAVEAAGTLWSLVGASAEIIDATVHDRMLAWSSHLPQFLSTTLALALNQGAVPYTEAGNAAREMLRLAASDARVWTAIGLDNADNLADALLHTERTLADLRAAIMAGDGQTLSDLLRAANSYVPEP